MRIMSMLAAALGLSFANFDRKQVFRAATPPARRKGLIDKSGLPSGYPGAKLARRAMQKGIAVKHHGLRQNGVTYKTTK